MITGTDITVWIVSALLGVGVGWSRYAKWKTRHKLVRELAAMDPDRRGKILSRLDPKLALEIRQQLMERFRIMS
jgi:flagellar motility protein MotE (MotC chaperone)